MPTALHRAGHLLVVAALPIALLISRPTHAATPDAPAPLPHLRITPRVVPLGARFAVRLTGLRAGVSATFILQPLHPSGFGGGIMGTWNADTHGAIGFSYPVGTRKWEIGRWRVAAGYAGRVSATRILTITPQR